MTVAIADAVAATETPSPVSTSSNVAATKRVVRRSRGQTPARFAVELPRPQHRFLKRFALNEDSDASSVVRALDRKPIASAPMAARSPGRHYARGLQDRPITRAIVVPADRMWRCELRLRGQLTGVRGPHAARLSANWPARWSVQRPQLTRCSRTARASCLAARAAGVSVSSQKNRVSAASRSRVCSLGSSLTGPSSAIVWVTLP